MTDEAFIKELAAMQKDLLEVKRGLHIAQTRYNHLKYRVDMLKRKVSASLRKEKSASQAVAQREDERQFSLGFEKNNE